MNNQARQPVKKIKKMDWSAKRREKIHRSRAGVEYVTYDRIAYFHSEVPVNPKRVVKKKLMKTLGISGKRARGMINEVRRQQKAMEATA